MNPQTLEDLRRQALNAAGSPRVPEGMAVVMALVYIGDAIRELTNEVRR
jgi:hypothetical protein